MGAAAWYRYFWKGDWLGAIRLSLFSSDVLIRADESRMDDGERDELSRNVGNDLVVRHGCMQCSGREPRNIEHISQADVNERESSEEGKIFEC